MIPLAYFYDEDDPRHGSVQAMDWYDPFGYYHWAQDPSTEGFVKSAWPGALTTLSGAAIGNWLSPQGLGFMHQIRLITLYKVSNTITALKWGARGALPLARAVPTAMAAGLAVDMVANPDTSIFATIFGHYFGMLDPWNISNFTFGPQKS